ncbi:MAG: hypothetical protein WAM54_14210 [Nitrososphaeraceae archaeon]
MVASYPVTVDGEEQLFPSALAFNVIFFICLILGIVLTIASRIIKKQGNQSVFSINADSCKVVDIEHNSEAYLIVHRMVFNHFFKIVVKSDDLRT